MKTKYILPFAKNIIFLRVMTVLFVVILIVFSVITFVSFASSPTDENLFSSIEPTLMVGKSFPATLTSAKPFLGISAITVAKEESVKVGDLILAINGGGVKTIKDAVEIVDNFPKNAEVKFSIVRPSDNYIFDLKTAASNIPNEFLIHLQHYVYVVDVIPKGASDRAGMRIGDLIVRINEKEFTNAQEADKILRLGQIGKSLHYEVLRKNEYTILDVTLAQFGIPIGLLLFSLSGICILLIGAFIAYSRLELIPARLVGFSFIFIGYVIAIVAIRRDYDITPFILVRNIMMTSGLFFGLTMLFHSHLYFPKELPELVSRKWISPGYYIAAFIGIIPAAIYNKPIFILVPVVYGLFIFIRFRKTRSTEYKQLSKIINYVSLIVGIFTPILFFLQKSPQSTTALGISGILFLTIPLSYLYTIGRYRLLDLSFRVRRNTQYSFSTFIWGSVIMYLLVWVLFKIPQMDLPSASILFTGASIEINRTSDIIGDAVPAERILLMILGITATFGFLKIRKMGQLYIDKKYFRLQYDYRKASHEFGELLSTTLTMEQLAHDLVEKLAELMKLKKVGVVFFRDEACCASAEAFGFNGKEWKEFCIEQEKQLIDAIKQFQHEFVVDYLPSPLKESFIKEGFHYIIPVRSKEKLLGVLLVGEKQSETTFLQEDLNFLSSVATQASVAIENAFLYEELAEKERMKHELEIARRIQLDSLPQGTPNIPGLDIAGISIPAMEVGGDFYDYLSASQQKITIIVGDVSGKGTSAALYMSKVQGILRSLHGFDLSPRNLFSRANALLCKDLEKRSFITALAVEFNSDKHTLTISRAGHLPLWYFNSLTQQCAAIIPKGIGLGLNDDGIFTAELEERTIKYNAGDIFLFATDGVTEARNSERTEFGESRLLHYFAAHPHFTATEIRDDLLAAISGFVGKADQHDDKTIVIVKAV